MTEFERPVIWVDSGDLADQADETWSALVDWSELNDPPRILVKDGVLARATARALEPYDRFSLREESSRAARFAKMTRSGNASPVYPPGEIMDALLRRDPDFYSGAQRVTAITDVPFVAPDGELVVREGIDSSGVYYRPAPGLEDVAPTGAESPEDVAEARDFLLDELLGDFDFKDDASRANALGLVLLPFVRHLIGDDPTPLHVISAPQPGSGKTYLVQAALIPGCGVVGLSPEPRVDEELRKLITSSLVAARPAIVFDNIGQRVASGTLASALTSRIWTDRILGQTKEVSLPVRCVWATTGNNWDGTPELVDRVAPIQLQPRGGTPARRRTAASFRHPDLHGWAIRNRARLVSSCLTLVSHWLEGATSLAWDGSFVREDYRQSSESTLGSFERWADTIGGVLAAANVRGFLGNLEEARLQMNVEEQETQAFLEAWFTICPTREIPSAELASMCQFGSPLASYLPAEIDTRDVQKSIRYWLRSHRGQRHGRFSLIGRGDGGAVSWHVEKAA